MKFGGNMLISKKGQDETDLCFLINFCWTFHVYFETDFKPCTASAVFELLWAML